MAEFIALTCPSCSGRLQVGPDIEQFACAHCGTEYIVNRGGGIVSLAPLVAGLAAVRAGVDRTASELAIIRLKEEVAEVGRRRAQLRDVAVRDFADEIEGTIWTLGKRSNETGWDAVMLRSLRGGPDWVATRLRRASAKEVDEIVRKLEATRAGHRAANLLREYARVSRSLGSRRRELRKHRDLVSGSS